MVKKYCCPGCGAEYDSLFELRVELVRVPGKESRHGYFCPKCGARIS
jgi:DNA-directed RNA polymerase subunit RPC12/RpoP